LTIFFKQQIGKNFYQIRNGSTKRLINPRVSNTPELDPTSIIKMILPKQPKNKINAVEFSSQTGINLTQMPAD